MNRQCQLCKMKKLLFAIVLLISTAWCKTLLADEGMWLPIFFSQGPEAEMKRLGMKISAEDIFSMNKPSLKDAICLFGGGCTAEIISDKGLILTNHHCGYSAVQAHSSLEQDYLTDGFWAKSFAEELSNPGLKVSILVKMEDVTTQVLEGIPAGLTADQRQALIDLKISTLEMEESKGSKNKISIKAFYSGNQYIKAEYLIFSDVRLVGAPPSRIGKFGGDTDNWMWPRHTGDFSVFRIYTDKDNNPADYSKENVPYTPPYHLTISLKGVQPDDFTFVYGYPGSTQEYLPSCAVDRITNFENPATINIRGKRLDIFRKYMEQSKLTRLQYSAKYAGIENYYKKMIGEDKGVKRTDIIAKKKLLEKQFMDWANSDENRKKEYGSIISDFEVLYTKYAENSLALEYLYEAGLGIEVVKLARGYEKLIQLSKNKKKNDDELLKYIGQLKSGVNGFFKNYDRRIDKEVMSAVLTIYFNNLDQALIPNEILQAGKNYKNDFNKYSDYVFGKSVLVDQQKLLDFLSSYNPTRAKMLQNDPAYKLAMSIIDYGKSVLNPKNEEFQNTFSELYRLYVKGLMEMMPEKKFYPDANSTLRVAYGKVSGFDPRDGVGYNYFTTLKGVIEKEDSTIYDYAVDEKLKGLYYKNDYGQYADKDGSMHVAFLATNHTTGGNSGSPVLNAEGQLIGINFDRVWEGTMSDIIYDPKMCRNISLDIRYCMFIIDKYAGADRLIDEMTFAK
jgi:hypothetical protein